MSVNDARCLFHLNGTFEHRKPAPPLPRGWLLKKLMAVFR